MKEINALIVDDIQEVRAIIRAVLKRMGAGDICEASNGIEALEILCGRGEPPECAGRDINMILCDINMPKMDGIRFLREIKGKEEFLHMGVIMITGDATSEKIVEAVKLGVDAFIVKPYTLSTLEEKIRKVLHNKRS